VKLLELYSLISPFTNQTKKGWKQKSLRSRREAGQVLVGSQGKIPGFRAKISLTVEARTKFKGGGKKHLLSLQTEESYCEGHRVFAFFLTSQDSRKIFSPTQDVEKGKRQLEISEYVQENMISPSGLSKSILHEVEANPEDP